MRVWRHCHTSASFVPWVDICHVWTKFGEGCRPLSFLLFLFWAIIAKHVREFGSLVWNSTFKTVTRPNLEFFVFAKKCFVWLWDLDQWIICNWLEPWNIEWCGTFLHLWSLHETFLVRGDKLLGLLWVNLLRGLVENRGTDLAWGRRHYYLRNLQQLLLLFHLVIIGSVSMAFNLF